jgi:hypothetical protein
MSARNIVSTTKIPAEVLFSLGAMRLPLILADGTPPAEICTSFCAALVHAAALARPASHG